MKTMLVSTSGFDYEGAELNDDGVFVYPDGDLDEDGNPCVLDLEREMDDFCANFDDLFSGAVGFVCDGSVDMWCGRGSGGRVLTRVTGARDFVYRFTVGSIQEDVRVDDEDGRLVVHESNHDGGMTMQVRELTDRGLEYYLNHSCDHYGYEGDETVIPHIFGSNLLSKEVRAANRVYGTPLN